MDGARRLPTLTRHRRLPAGARPLTAAAPTALHLLHHLLHHLGGLLRLHLLLVRLEVLPNPFLNNNVRALQPRQMRLDMLGIVVHRRYRDHHAIGQHRVLKLWVDRQLVGNLLEYLGREARPEGALGHRPDERHEVHPVAGLRDRGALRHRHQDVERGDLLLDLLRRARGLGPEPAEAPALAHL